MPDFRLSRAALNLSLNRFFVVFLAN